MTKCPTPSVLTEYLQDALPAKASLAIRSHLQACESCRARAQEIAVSEESPTVETAVTSLAIQSLSQGAH